MGVTPDSDSGTWPELFRQLIVTNSHYWFNQEVTGALREIPQVLKALSYALSLAEAWEPARALILRLSPPLIRQGYGADWERILTRAINRSAEEKDPAEIDFLLQLGMLYRLQGRLSEAQDRFQKAMKQAGARQRHWALANQLGLVARLSGRYEEALAHCGQVLAEENIAPSERAEAFNVLGLVAHDRREWELALAHFEEALALYRSVEDAYQIARLLNNRGLVLLRSGRLDEAEAAYQEAIYHFQASDSQTERFKAVMNLGNVFLMRKEYEKAIHHYQEALPIFQQSHYLVDLSHTYNNLGMAYTGLADWARAEAYFKASMEFWQRLEDAYNLANVLDNLGEMFIKAGQVEQARASLNQALQVLAMASNDPAHRRLQQVIEGRLAQL